MLRPQSRNEIIDKWYLCIYVGVKGKKSLCIGKAIERFLYDEGGGVTKMEMDCLKPHVGNDNIMESYPAGQKDKYMCDITNIFTGPVIIYPKPKGKWEVPNLPEIKFFYTKIVGLDRVAIFNSVF